MDNDIKLNPQELQIRGLLDRYLVSRDRAEVGDHADDDTLSAFVEGTLSEREGSSLVRHLVDCGFCRNTTAELFTLRFDFEETVAEPAAIEQPTKLSEVLSGLFSKIFGSSEGAVFAHEDKKDDDGSEGETKTDQSDDEEK